MDFSPDLPARSVYEALSSKWVTNADAGGARPWRSDPADVTVGEGSDPRTPSGVSVARPVSVSVSEGVHWWGPESAASQTQPPSGVSFQRPSVGPGPSH